MLLLLAALSFPLLPDLAPQDLQLDNVRVCTGTAAPWTGPLVVVGGRIQPPGTAAPAGAKVLDLGGAFVYPGLQDAHGHLRGLGDALCEIDLVGTKSFDEVIARVAAAAAKTPKRQWLVGRGWDQNDWAVKDMPHHVDLSVEVTEHPVWLVRVDGHAGLLNMAGLRTAGIDRDTPTPSGGEILKGEDGEPTGVLVDAAMGLVSVPEPDADEARQRLLRAQAACLAAGLTCVHDAGVGHDVLEDLKLLHAAGKWHLRTYVMLAARETELIKKGPWRSKDGLLVVRAVKGYADGALGSRGACLLAPYADRPGHKGLMLTPERGLAELAKLCAGSGMQLCVHAIGDAANRAVLNAYAATSFPGERAAARFRVEHAQVIADADFARFKELSVIPSMQPTHLTSDMPWAEARLGKERVMGAYAWRRFHALGVPVAFGSDFPVESVDPRKGLFAAVTTRAESGGPADGYRPDQKTDRARALQGFTQDAAFAMFAEQDLGTIEPGKIADLTVFDRDLLTCPEDELLKAKVVLTVIGGRVVGPDPPAGKR